jgi:large subunit ribosomal protein L25
MKVMSLKGVDRTDLGKSANKKIRQDGQVPCVVYGNGTENTNFSLYKADLRDLIYTPEVFLVQLSLNSGAKLAKLHDIQYHPVNEEILHVDFYEVDPKRPVSMHIPVKLAGTSPGVLSGGKLQLKIKKLLVKGLIQDFPEFIEVNINELEMSKSVRVKDVSVPNLELLDTGANSIVSCIITRAARAAMGASKEEGKKGK